MNFRPTKEQIRIFKFIEKRPENILIEAYAGTGKTTTIVEAVKLLPKTTNITFLAFNKHIQEELKTKLPENVRCYTSHGLGMSAIKRKYGDSIKFDEFKADKHIQKKAKRWGLNNEFKSEEEIVRYLSNMKKMVNLCRLSLTLDKKYIPYIADRYEVPLNKTKDIPRLLKVLDAMTQDRKIFDYTDMVYLPAVDNGLWLFPQDYVVVDECLPYRENILTTDGPITIGTLCKRYEIGEILPEVITFNENKKVFENKKINKIWSNGKKDIHIVKLNNNRKLKSTINHKFLTDLGWKRLDELKVGDAILSNSVRYTNYTLPSEDQRNIVIGSSIGDGSIDKLKSQNLFRLRCVHGTKQKEYLEWKAKMMNSKSFIVKNNGYSGNNIHKFNTRGLFFRENLKSHSEIVKCLNAKSLAILWMDDGNMGKLENSGTLFALAPNENSVKLLQQKLLNTFNIKTTLRCRKSSSTKNKYYCLLFNKENIHKLSSLIAPYIHPSMKYKIIKEHHTLINLKNWSYDYNKYGCMIVHNKHKFLKHDNVYDMEVEDNHNFIIPSTTSKRRNTSHCGVVAHNCQDINRAQQRLIEKMLKKDKMTKKYKGRLIAIGDGFQSIYGFTGITDKTFQWFKQFPNTKTLPLSYSFRCAKKIIEHANNIVPNIKALENAPEGIVREGSVYEAKDGDFVLCRTTKPLIKIFFELLSQQKKAIIKGKDIGLQLIQLIGNFKDINKLITYWKTELNTFKKDLIKSGIINPSDHTGYAALEDKVGTLLFLANMSENIPALKNNIEIIFTDKLEGIILSTIHKAKGLEANKVIIIRPDLIPLPNTRGWQITQEKNLEYVAITRAKTELVYDVEWTDENE